MAWTDNLLPGSWRGVPFLIRAHDWGSGRRVASHEYALRDTPSTEDMGRRQRTYILKAYVIADLVTQDYFANRDALRQACEMKGVGTLVHPYLGPLRVRLGPVKMTETAEDGGTAIFEMSFVESGTKPIPRATANTASSLLSGLASILPQIMAAYAIGSLIASRPGILFGLAANALGVFAGNMLGLPASVTAGLGQLGSQLAADLEAGGIQVTSSISGVTGDPVAIGVTDACLTVAANAVALQQAAAPTPDPVTGQASTAPAMTADPTYGLAALSGWGAALPPPAGLQVGVQQQAQQAIIDLVSSAAVVASAQVYANTSWTTADAATAAKEALLDYLQQRLLAAAAIGADGLFQAWLSVTGLVIADFNARAQNLPSLTAYATPARLPAPVLAQILYQDATQADLLVSLNNVIHPGFMPMNGVALTRLPSEALS